MEVFNRIKLKMFSQLFLEGKLLLLLFCVSRSVILEEYRGQTIKKREETFSTSFQVENIQVFPPSSLSLALGI